VKQSDSYSNNFSFEGANAPQAYLDDLSDDLDEPMEFDPIAWCCEYTEYGSYGDFENDTGYTADGVEHKGYEDINNLEELKEHTTVIEVENSSKIIVQDF